MRLQNITVIQVHASILDHDHKEVEQLYEQLDIIITKTPKKDILVVQGKWTAKVVPDVGQEL